MVVGRVVALEAGVVGVVGQSMGPAITKSRNAVSEGRGMVGFRGSSHTVGSMEAGLC